MVLWLEVFRPVHVPVPCSCLCLSIGQEMEFSLFQIGIFIFQKKFLLWPSVAESVCIGCIIGPEHLMIITVLTGFYVFSWFIIIMNEGWTSRSTRANVFCWYLHRFDLLIQFRNGNWNAACSEIDSSNFEAVSIRNWNLNAKKLSTTTSSSNRKNTKRICNTFFLTRNKPDLDSPFQQQRKKNYSANYLSDLFVFCFWPIKWFAFKKIDFNFL